MLQFQLLYKYKKNAGPTYENQGNRKIEASDFPFITIQLPIYNEQYVVERLIDNICKFDYPKDKFEIHVLDDSSDETIELTKKKVEDYQKLGFNIAHIRRADRKGFKAGALKEGMKYAKGEFIAIFDADFLPRPDFLIQTIPYFKNKQVGVVQARWEHLNRDYSVLTKLQALQLNVHFTVEQMGRKAGNYMLQFNGTAGIWRKTTIEDAGGWEADTLTEDLDLSYRAQLRGWKIVYLEKVGTPAELPAEMNGLKSQQFRWMKGGAETAKKMLPTVWRSDLAFGQKVHATSHLMASSIFIFIFIAGVFSVPLIFVLKELYLSVFFLLGLLSIISIFYVANVQAEIVKESYSKKLLKFIVLFPLFLALSMGLSLHNTIAVIQGYIGKQSPFIRTPKFNIKGIEDTFQKRKYFSSKWSWTIIWEGILSIYFLAGCVAGILLGNTEFIAYHLLLMVGFGTIFFYSVIHLKLR